MLIGQYYWNDIIIDGNGIANKPMIVIIEKKWHWPNEMMLLMAAWNGVMIILIVVMKMTVMKWNQILNINVKSQ